jgi:hypothetical protein
MTNDTYIPPSMPKYPETLDELFQVLAPYHHEQRPLDLFFEFYIIDVLGYLPGATDTAIRQLIEKFPAFFSSTNGVWRLGIERELNLSETIDVAILDLWLRNSHLAKGNGWFYHPWHFAKNFLDNYFVDGSKIDVWAGNALELAKARIRSHRIGS